MNDRSRNKIKAMRKYWQILSLNECTYYIPKVNKMIKIIFEKEVEQ